MLDNQQKTAQEAKQVTDLYNALKQLITERGKRQKLKVVYDEAIVSKVAVV